MTAPLYRADVQLGLGLVATIEIVEHDPAPPPPSGAEWAREVDWPIAKLRLSLPSRPSDSYLADALLADMVLLGSRLSNDWGCPTRDDQHRSVAGPRHVTHKESAEYLEDAVAALRTRAEAELAPLIAHVAKRAARLAEREAALARGRAGRPRPTESELPIETDSTPSTAAPDLTDDDSSQRFALLELDDPKPVRAKRTKKAA